MMSVKVLLLNWFKLLLDSLNIIVHTIQVSRLYGEIFPEAARLRFDPFPKSGISDLVARYETSSTRLEVADGRTNSTHTQSDLSP